MGDQKGEKLTKGTPHSTIECIPRNQGRIKIHQSSPGRKLGAIVVFQQAFCEHDCISQIKLQVCIHNCATTMNGGGKTCLKFQKESHGCRVWLRHHPHQMKMPDNSAKNVTTLAAQICGKNSLSDLNDVPSHSLKEQQSTMKCLNNQENWQSIWSFFCAGAKLKQSSFINK